MLNKKKKIISRVESKTEANGCPSVRHFHHFFQSKYLLIVRQIRSGLLLFMRFSLSFITVIAFIQFIICLNFSQNNSKKKSILEFTKHKVNERMTQMPAFTTKFSGFVQKS